MAVSCSWRGCSVFLLSGGRHDRVGSASDSMWIPFLTWLILITLSYQLVPRHYDTRDKTKRQARSGSVSKTDDPPSVHSYHGQRTYRYFVPPSQMDSWEPFLTIGGYSQFFEGRKCQGSTLRWRKHDRLKESIRMCQGWVRSRGEGVSSIIFLVWLDYTRQQSNQR